MAIGLGNMTAPSVGISDFERFTLGRYLQNVFLTDDSDKIFAGN
jgi:hypothetical protein